MSRANAQVRFPDGTIKYGIYNGTVDYYWHPLFDTPEEAWQAWNSYYKSTPMDDSSYPHYDGMDYVEQVEIADDYGSGDTYRGTATKRYIASNLEADLMVKKSDGLPEWWVSDEPSASADADRPTPEPKDYNTDNRIKNDLNLKTASKLELKDYNIDEILDKLRHRGMFDYGTDDAKPELYQLILEVIIGEDEHSANIDTALADREYFSNLLRATQRQKLSDLFNIKEK